MEPEYYLPTFFLGGRAAMDDVEFNWVEVKLKHTEEPSTASYYIVTITNTISRETAREILVRARVWHNILSVTFAHDGENASLSETDYEDMEQLFSTLPLELRLIP